MDENRVLIAVDLSENSLAAIDYVGKMLSCHKLARVTLLHVIREPSQDVIPDEDARRDQVERQRAEALSVMEHAGSKLAARGIPEATIRIKIQVCGRQVSIAELLLQERSRENYATIVVGRRGVSKREEFLFGSVSSRIVREARNCAVWVVS